MKSQLVKLKRISPGPLMTIAAWVGILNYLLRLLTGTFSLGPSTSIAEFLLRYGVFLLINILLNAFLWVIAAGLLMAFVNLMLHRSGGLAFEFEIGQEPAPKPAPAPLPQFAPPPSDPPDPRQRRAQAEQALDAQSKILRR